MKKHLQEAQREGRIKETTINKAYIESGEYRKKFDRISSDKNLNRLIYMCAKEMLYHRSGTTLEDMYWIDPVACRVVAKETNQKLKGKIKYSNATKRVIGHYDRLITIHTHPYSSPPSIEDFNSNYWNHYDIGIVCCHNGKVFIYTAKELLIPKQFKLQMHEIIEMGYDEFDAQMMTLKKLQENHDITCLEV